MGMPNIIAKVRRSRRIWINSFRMIATKRAKKTEGDHAGRPTNARRAVQGSLEIVAGGLHQADEHVFQTGSIFCHAYGSFWNGPMARSMALASRPLT